MASRASRLIGLDVGSTSVKAARIRRRGERVLVTDVAYSPIESAGEAAATTDEKIVKAVWRCLRVLGGRPAVVCSIAGPQVAVRTFEFPPVPRHQLASAVELEAAQVCPFEVAEASVSHQVLATVTAKGSQSPAEERIRGFFAAAQNEIVRRRRSLCEQAEGSCVMMDVDGLALLNCLEACHKRQKGETVMVLNVGHSFTNVAIASDDGLPFVRDISFASNEILTRIARIADLSRPKVEAALAGAEDSDVHRVKLQPAIRQGCAGLADRVTETLRYYGTRKTGPAVDRIYLCGGFTESGAVAKALISLLPAKTELWDPLAVLPCTRRVRKGAVAEHGPAMAVAIGLALRTLRDVHD